MPTSHSVNDADAHWRQQEEALARLHDAARAASSTSAFYRQLVEEVENCFAGAVATSVWLTTAGGALELAIDGGMGSRTEQLPKSRKQAAAALAAERVGNDGDRLFHPIRSSAVGAQNACGAAVVELHFSPESAAELRSACSDFVAAAVEAAGDCHAFAELQRLTAGEGLHRSSGPLVRSMQRENQLIPLAYAAANEGRRLLSCERLTVLLRRGRRLRVVAVSGVDHVEARTEFSRRAESLAQAVADWGEPIAAGEPAGADELPPLLADSLAAYLDQTHARTVAAASIAFQRDDSDKQAATSLSTSVQAADAVFLAEWFSTAGPSAAAVQTAELGELCAGALQRAAAIDGPLTRRLVGRAQRRAAANRFAGPRWLLAVAGLAAVVGALILTPARFEAAAPATLLPVERHEIFATASGRVAEIHVVHGQHVAAGEALATIDDPQLQLQWEQVVGELETVNRRYAALAVARTERSVRERRSPDALPPGAEQQQLAERRDSLERQRNLLSRRRDELTLRSPAAGMVLTRDVESLLASRPVERGQVLLTVANPDGPWELLAELEQRDVGRLIAAQDELGPDRPVRFRLAGDVQRVREGRVVRIDQAAALDVDDLAEPPPGVAVHIAVDDAALDDAPRPGLQAEVRIDCGERSLGYVWFHDLAAAAYRWWSF